MLLTITSPDGLLDLPHQLDYASDALTHVPLGSGDAHVFFPERGDGQSRAAVLYMPRERCSLSTSRLHQLASALAHAFGATASKLPIPITPDPAPVVELELTPIPGPIGSRWSELFGPLGWEITTTLLTSKDADESHFFNLRLTGRVELGQALNQVYTLLPYIEGDEAYTTIEEGIDRGNGWLTSHPSCRNIVRWYFNHHPSAQEIRERMLSHRAGDRTLPTEDNPRLYESRMEAVVAALAGCNVSTVTDLGCGRGELLVRLINESWLNRLVGVDACAEALEAARARLQASDAQANDRLVLLHGGLTYRDHRWMESDAITLIEVIEHVEPERLGTVAYLVFGEAHPRVVIVTTPNREFNSLYNFLRPNELRHPDHRFEWTRAEFRSWAERIAEMYGYDLQIEDVGRLHESFGSPTQMAVFTR